MVGVLSIVAGAIGNEGLFRLNECMNGPLGCVGLVWFIMGLVYRYREVGNVCSGDYVLAGSAQDGQGPYLWAQGHFINLYYVVVMWVLIGLCACACCVGIPVAICMSMKKPQIVEDGEAVEIREGDNIEGVVYVSI